MDIKDRIAKVRERVKTDKTDLKINKTGAVAKLLVGATFITTIGMLGKAMERKAFNPDKDYAAAVDGYVDNYAFHGEMAIPSNALQLEFPKAVNQIEEYMNTDEAYGNLSHESKQEIASAILSNIQEIENGKDSNDTPIEIDTGSKYGKTNVSVATPKGHRGIRGKGLREMVKNSKRAQQGRYGVVSRGGVVVR